MPLKVEIVNMRKICSEILEKYKSKRKKWPLQIQSTILEKREYLTGPGIAFGSKQTRIKFTTSIVYLRLLF